MKSLHDRTQQNKSESSLKLMPIDSTQCSPWGYPKLIFHKYYIFNGFVDCNFFHCTS